MGGVYGALEDEAILALPEKTEREREMKGEETRGAV